MTEATESLVHIRTAKPTDSEEIIRLIIELAVFEGDPDGCKITADTLREDGFGEDRFFRCLVAEDSSQNSQSPEEHSRLVGYALYFYGYSTWLGRLIYLEDFYVTPSHRGKGLGTELWRAVVKEAVERNCKKMQWICLEWNERSIAYYARRGGENITRAEQWNLFRMNRENMERFVEEA